MSDMFELGNARAQEELVYAGRTALITGGGAGVGRACATILAQRGSNVVVADVVPARVEEAVAGIRAIGKNALGLVVDISQPTQIQKAIDDTVATYGRLDVMLNIAGIIRIRNFLDVTPEDWWDTMAINAAGTFFGTQFAAKQMIKQTPERKPGECIGRIVNASSPSAWGNSVDQMAYCASKAAINRITGGAASALWTRYGIAVAAIKPIAVPSPMWEHIGSTREQTTGKPHGVPAYERARTLVYGRFQAIETHAEVLAWMAAAPGEVINGHIVTSTANVDPL
jgi:NAD(P)-dependent dehydrogenase (short-subunit alcohol dehydrogenase family)